MTTAKVAGTKIAGTKRKCKTTCPTKGARKKIGAKTYTVKGNHKLKSVATKSANASKKTGKLARIVKSATCGYTVLIAGRSTGRKKATNTASVTGTRKRKTCSCHKRKRKVS